MNSPDQIKNTVESLNNRLDQTEKRISEFEYRSFGISSQSSNKTNKKVKRQNEDSL